MKAIVAATGPSRTRLARLEAVLNVPLDQIDLGTGVLVAVGGAPAVRVDREHGRSIISLGAGRSRGDEGTGVDTAEDGMASLYGTHGDGLYSSLGRGPNHMFHVRTPEGGGLASTNLFLLSVLLGQDCSIDRSYEDFLLGFGFLPDDRTVLSGVVSQPAGTVVGIGDISTAPTASGPSTADTPPLTREQARDELFHRFMATVEDQAGGERDHAVLLGGLDSALVVAALRRLGHRVTTYTFQFEDERYNQRNVDVVRTGLGTRHESIRITPQVISEGMATFGRWMNQPSPQPHYQLHTIAGSQLVAEQGFSRVFTGDGCDAIFLGYPTVSRRAALTRRLGRVPAMVRRPLHRTLALRPVEARLGHVARIGRSTLASLDLPYPARGHLPTQYLDSSSLVRLRAEPPPRQVESIAAIRHRISAHLHDLEPTRLAFHGNALTGQSRAKVEAAFAASGVRQVSPFMHPAIVGFVQGLPASYLRSQDSPAGASGKELLIEMVRAHAMLPEILIRQPKQSPSDSPIDAWYAGPLREQVRSLLHDLPFEVNDAYVAELLSPKRAERWFREHVSISHHAMQAIGLLWSYAAVARPCTQPLRPPLR